MTGRDRAIPTLKLYLLKCFVREYYLPEAAARIRLSQSDIPRNIISKQDSQCKPTKLERELAEKCMRAVLPYVIMRLCKSLDKDTMSSFSVGVRRDKRILQRHTS